MFEEVTHKESRWKIFWPDVTSEAGAREAIKLGSWAASLATILAVVDSLLSGPSLFTV